MGEIKHRQRVSTSTGAKGLQGPLKDDLQRRVMWLANQQSCLAAQQKASGKPSGG